MEREEHAFSSAFSSAQSFAASASAAGDSWDLRRRADFLCVQPSSTETVGFDFLGESESLSVASSSPSPSFHSLSSELGVSSGTLSSDAL